jgi:thiol-disulfide isomerase/thioredoxin
LSKVLIADIIFVMKYILVIAALLIIGGVIYINTDKIMPEDMKLDNILKSAKLPVKGEAPELAGIDGWINSEPLTLEGLRGKVVLVDFWTYTCINCIRTFPHITAWYEKYKDNGFVLLGVHSPEFRFEKKKENVERTAAENNLDYPIALDNDMKTWNAFANRYWPAKYLIDAEGNIRYTHFGEGRYEETEKAIQQLLLEAGHLSVNEVTEVKEAAMGVDIGKIGTPEIYLGYLRINNLGNKDEGVLPGTTHTFSEVKSVEENRFYFVGDWKIEREFSEFVGEPASPAGKIIIRYKANKINVVLDTKDGVAVPLELKLDGEYLIEQNKGADVIMDNGKSTVNVLSPGFYNLVDTGEEYEWHTLEIIINSSGLQAFAFTFG